MTRRCGILPIGWAGYRRRGKKREGAACARGNITDFNSTSILCGENLGTNLGRKCRKCVLYWYRGEADSCLFMPMFLHILSNSRRGANPSQNGDAGGGNSRLRAVLVSFPQRWRYTCRRHRTQGRKHDKLHGREAVMRKRLTER